MAFAFAKLNSLVKSAAKNLDSALDRAIGIQTVDSKGDEAGAALVPADVAPTSQRPRKGKGKARSTREVPSTSNSHLHLNTGVVTIPDAESPLPVADVEAVTDGALRTSEQQSGVETPSESVRDTESALDDSGAEAPAVAHSLDVSPRGGSIGEPVVLPSPASGSEHIASAAAEASPASSLSRREAAVDPSPARASRGRLPSFLQPAAVIKRIISAGTPTSSAADRITDPTAAAASPSASAISSAAATPAARQAPQSQQFAADLDPDTRSPSLSASASPSRSPDPLERDWRAAAPAPADDSVPAQALTGVGPVDAVASVSDQPEPMNGAADEAAGSEATQLAPADSDSHLVGVGQRHSSTAPRDLSASWTGGMPTVAGSGGDEAGDFSDFSQPSTPLTSAASALVIQTQFPGQGSASLGMSTTPSPLVRKPSSMAEYEAALISSTKKLKQANTMARQALQLAKETKAEVCTQCAICPVWSISLFAHLRSFAV